MTEQWKPHSVHSNYEISDLGRVRRCTSGRQRSAGELLSLSKSGAGYFYAVMFPGRHCARVNRLVLEAFVGMPEEGQVCRHLNGDKTDNKLTNLCWGTPAQNSADREKHGNTKHGSANGNSRLTEEAVSEIRARYKKGGITQTELAKEFNTSQYCVYYIMNGGWAHI